MCIKCYVNFPEYNFPCCVWQHSSGPNSSLDRWVPPKTICFTLIHFQLQFLSTQRLLWRWDCHSQATLSRRNRTFSRTCWAGGHLPKTSGITNFTQQLIGSIPNFKLRINSLDSRVSIMARRVFQAIDYFRTYCSSCMLSSPPKLLQPTLHLCHPQVKEPLQQQRLHPPHPHPKYNHYPQYTLQKSSPKLTCRSQLELRFGFYRIL